MRPLTARAEFEKFTDRFGFTVASLTPLDGIGLMLAFYRQIRADNCPVDQDGDMLLYEWGTYDWGKGPYFQCDITRQFIEAGFEADDGISQLSLCFYYPPLNELKIFEPGSRWCSSPAELSDFETYIKSHTVYLKLANVSPARIEVEYSKV